MKQNNRTWVLGLIVVVLAVALALSAGVGAEGASPRRGLDTLPEGMVSSMAPVQTDTTLKAWWPTVNYETDGSLELRSPGISRPLIQFDLSGVDFQPGMCVCNATLKLYVKSRSNASTLWVSAYPVTTTWQPSQVSWNLAAEDTPWQAAGCDGDEDRWHEDEATEVHRVRDWIEIDVTDMVAEWLNGSMDNNGMLLIGRAGTSVAYVLASSEYLEGAYAPQLEVVTMALPTPEPTEVPEPILVIDKIGPSGTLELGDYYTVTYDITVSNPSDRDLSGVVVTDVLPLGTEMLNCSLGGLLDAGSGLVEWTIGDLSAGMSSTVQIELGVLTWVRGDGILINLARATHAEAEDAVAEGSWAMPIVVPTVAPSPTPCRMYLPLIFCP